MRQFNYQCRERPRAWVLSISARTWMIPSVLRRVARHVLLSLLPAVQPGLQLLYCKCFFKNLIFHVPACSIPSLFVKSIIELPPPTFFGSLLKIECKKEIKRENEYIGRLQIKLQFLVLFSIYWAFFFSFWWTPVHIILIKTVHLSYITCEHWRQLQTKQSNTFLMAVIS